MLNNGTLAFKRSDTVLSTAQSQAPAASLRPAPARLILTGANAYTGGTTIAAGTLQVGNGGTAGSTSAMCQ